MSILAVQSLVDFPTEAVLDQILDVDSLDIVSPFYSGWALQKLNTRRYSRIRFITRLPDQFHAAPPVLDNDPKPLKQAMERLGTTLSVFALPTVHAKLYISPREAWLGSANFSRNGFSGKGELMLHISPKANNLDQTFRRFLQVSKRVSSRDISFLADCVTAGTTKINTIRNSEDNSPDNSAVLALSYDDFSKWISSQASATYINDRISNKNRMSGHVYSGFYGLCAFFSQHPSLVRGVLQGRVDEASVLDKLARFIRRHGSRFGGPRGGTWNSKLSTRLGGTQSGGGAGDVVIKHLLPLVAGYMQRKGLI